MFQCNGLKTINISNSVQDIFEIPEKIRFTVLFHMHVGAHSTIQRIFSNYMTIQLLLSIYMNSKSMWIQSSAE